MDRDWLEAQLAAGRSIESIAREVGKHPSTVGYWVKKYGLTLPARGQARRARRARPETPVELVERGMSVRADRQGAGAELRRVQYWLAKYELKTEPHHYSRRDAEKPPSFLRECATHGWTDFVRFRRARLLPLPEVRDGAVAAPPPGEGAPRRRGRRQVRAVRVRHLRRRAPLSPPRSVHQALPGEPRGDHRIARSSCGKKRGNACYCAQTATRRWRRGWCFWPLPRADNPG